MRDVELVPECVLEPVTVSMAYLYLEKLVLQHKHNKQNCKLLKKQQMEEQGKNPTDQTNEEEIDSLPEKE